MTDLRAADRDGIVRGDGKRASPARPKRDGSRPPSWYGGALGDADDTLPARGPKAQADSVELALRFVLRIDGLKQVERRNPLADGSRRERSAEH